MPFKLHKTDRYISDGCWKDCGLPGYFCFWLCPRLQPFWNQVITQNDLIADINLPKDPVVTILNIWQGFALDTLHKELVELMLCATHS